MAAVVVDPMATAIAVGVPPDEYQRELRDVCDRYGVHLICDEVIAGMGRTGRFFATEHAGIQADFITVSKGSSSGYFPIAACLVASHISDIFVEQRAAFRHGHTYSGHPMGAAAALAVLSRMKRDRFWERAQVTARSRGSYVSPHFYPQIHQHYVFGWNFLDHIEMIPTDRPFERTHDLIQHDALKRVSNGRLTPPSEAGAGFVLNEEAVKRWARRNGSVSQ